jgi:hypothetical protein
LLVYVPGPQPTHPLQLHSLHISHETTAKEAVGRLLAEPRFSYLPPAQVLVLHDPRYTAAPASPSKMAAAVAAAGDGPVPQADRRLADDACPLLLQPRWDRSGLQLVLRPA